MLFSNTKGPFKEVAPLWSVYCCFHLCTPESDQNLIQAWTQACAFTQAIYCSQAVTPIG